MILVDTNIILWLRTAPERLKRDERRTLDRARVRYQSVVTLWEIAILMGLGRLPQEGGFFDLPDGFDLLPVRPEHCRVLSDLPRIHGDPFDRMLIAQARYEQVPLLSRDRAIADYGDAGLVTVSGHPGGSGNSSR